MPTKSDFYGKVGFASPASKNKLIERRRAGIALIATVGLALSLVIALTAVSIGAARAQVLGAVTESRDASWAIGAFVALVMTGAGGFGGPTANK